MFFEICTGNKPKYKTGLFIQGEDRNPVLYRKFQTYLTVSGYFRQLYQGENSDIRSAVRV